MSMVLTAALIRLGFLVLWAFFCLFERRPRVMIWALAGALMAGNVFAILASFLMEGGGM